jgi:hypothetical protein
MICLYDQVPVLQLLITSLFVYICATLGLFAVECCVLIYGPTYGSCSVSLHLCICAVANSHNSGAEEVERLRRHVIIADSYFQDQCLPKNALAD